MKVRDGCLDLIDKCWSDDFADIYTERGCEGVLVGTMRGPGLNDLNFLLRIPRLQRISVFGPVRDCSVITSLSNLRELHLPGSYKGPLPLAGLALRSLTVPTPSDLSGLADRATIERLLLTDWPKAHVSLSLLGAKPELNYLRIEFKRTAVVSVSGFAAPELKELWLYDGRLTDVRHLVRMTKLQSLRIHSTRIASLDFVRQLPQLTTLTIENGGDLESLEPLRGHPRLSEVAFVGRTTMINGDLTPLLELPAAKSVALERGSPHYSHKPADVRLP